MRNVNCGMRNKISKLIKSRVWNFNSGLNSLRNSESPPPSPSPSRGEGWGGGVAFQKGFTLIEIIIVIVILCIVSGITIKFLVDSMRIYSMTVNQKTLFDEGKLALERMCRDIRDANSITGTTASSITFIRDNATVQDVAGETIIFRWNGGANPLEKVKASPASTTTMAVDVSAFVVTNATNEIQLRLTLQLTSGERVTLQTKVYPKNLPEDVTSLTATYNKHFLGIWKEVKSPDTT
jgi:prepilin-type N-terminal cleavage/methylation domain-containing protein